MTEQLKLGLVPIFSISPEGIQTCYFHRKEDSIWISTGWRKRIDFCVEVLGADTVTREVRKLFGDRDSVAEFFENKEDVEKYNNLKQVLCEASFQKLGTSNEATDEF